MAFYVLGSASGILYEQTFNKTSEITFFAASLYSSISYKPSEME